MAASDSIDCGPNVERLMAGVGRRLRLISLMKSLALSMLVLGGMYVGLLCLSRFAGLFPEVLAPWTMALVPAFAVLAAVLMHRAPSRAGIAHKIDTEAGTKDLFLTATQMRDESSQYVPIVRQNARLQAESLKAGDLVSFNFQREVRDVAIVAAAILIAFFALPQLDPFGKVEAIEVAKEQETLLEKSKNATKVRKSELKSKKEEDSEDADLDESLNNLKQALKTMKPNAPKFNGEVLNKKQKELGEKYQALRKEAMSSFMKQSDSDMARLSRWNGENKLDEWTRELQKGDTSEIEKAIEEAISTLQKLDATSDPIEKEELKQQLKKQMSELKKFAEDRAGSQAMAQALERAMQQMEIAENKDLSEEAIQAAIESMQLAEQELEQVAESAKDLKALEDAMKTMQMAKQLNQQKKLDGEACKNCMSMGDYQAIYEQMMQGSGGMESDEIAESNFNGRGTGKGGTAPEDDSEQTAFKTERASSPITAGKMLMSMKTKGLGKQGERDQNYKDNIQRVKEGVAEAIEQEQVPPGYRDGIKGYFDSIETIEE